MPPILQSNLPFAPWMDPRTARLPGILPLTHDHWTCIDDAFAGQMKERDRLIEASATLVHALQTRAIPAAQELYATLLKTLSTRPGFKISPHHIRRPDGILVPLDPGSAAADPRPPVSGGFLHP